MKWSTKTGHLLGTLSYDLLRLAFRKTREAKPFQTAGENFDDMKFPSEAEELSTNGFRTLRRQF